MLVHESDTITAIATPIGEGGISVVRVSGPGALSIAQKGFKGKVELAAVPSHTAHFGSLIDNTGETIDDVVALVFRKPHSYTGEDVVELSCHGGMFVTRKLLETMIGFGARLAQPGEFTKRAFLNGRMDLAQAEAVADLIHARSQTAHRSSLFQLKGGLSDKINSIRDQLINAISLLELELDFAEEGYEFANKSDVSSHIKSILNQIDELLSSYQIGKLYREGVKVVLAGAPNVGKSSLLNALLKQNRAIVTDIPGTTRDTIEESLTIGGLLFTVTDTAGLREATDPIELEGVRRAEEQLFNSDLLLLMFDCSRDLTEREVAYARRLLKDVRANRKACIEVINKIDLRRPDEKFLAEAGVPADGYPIVRISARTAEGLDELKSLLVNTVLTGKQISEESSPTITSARHQSALTKAKESLMLALQSVTNKQSVEFVVVDLRAALDSLGAIVGVVTTDDILNNIFSRFCIGK
ncbi:MAG: tRNA uridine-5-carboxymethylaminomethyl(34) synthesis GTPase MnmE [Bacteroidota bacterium]